MTNSPRPSRVSSTSHQSACGSATLSTRPNYEVSSRTVSTIAAGYTIENIFVAIMLNRAGAVAEPNVKETQELVGSIAGVRTERGDLVRVSVLDFAVDASAVGSMGATEQLLSRFGGQIINGMVALLGGIAIMGIAVRPVVAALKVRPIELVDSTHPAKLSPDVVNEKDAEKLPVSPDSAALLDLPNEHPRRRLRERIEHIILADEDEASALLREWLKKDEAS